MYGVPFAQFCGATDEQLDFLQFKEQEHMLITACARILADHVAQLNADSSKDTEAAVDVASLALGAQKQSPIGDEEAQPSSIAAAIQNTIERSECGLLLVEQMRKMVTQEAATSRTLAEETRLPVAVLEGKADSETLLVQQLSQSNAHIQLCDSLAKSFASGPATTVRCYMRSGLRIVVAALWWFFARYTRPIFVVAILCSSRGLIQIFRPPINPFSALSSLVGHQPVQMNPRVPQMSGQCPSMQGNNVICTFYTGRNLLPGCSLPLLYRVSV